MKFKLGFLAFVLILGVVGLVKHAPPGGRRIQIGQMEIENEVPSDIVATAVTTHGATISPKQAVEPSRVLENDPSIKALAMQIQGTEEQMNHEGIMTRINDHSTTPQERHELMKQVHHLVDLKIALVDRQITTLETQLHQRQARMKN